MTCERCNPPPVERVVRPHPTPHPLPGHVSLAELLTTLPDARVRDILYDAGKLRRASEEDLGAVAVRLAYAIGREEGRNEALRQVALDMARQGQSGGAE